MCIMLWMNQGSNKKGSVSHNTFFIAALVQHLLKKRNKNLIFIVDESVDHFCD